MQSRSKTCDQTDTGNAFFMTSAFWWLVLMYSMRISSTEKASQVLATLMRWNLAKCLSLGLKPFASIAGTAWLSSYTVSTKVEAITLTNRQKRNGIPKQRSAQGHKLGLRRRTWNRPLSFWSPKDDSERIWTLKSKNRATSRLHIGWWTKITVNKKRQPQLSWRVTDTHHISIINGGSDVANETSCSLIIIGTPSCDMTCKCVDCNHDIWATDPTKPHQFHDKFCGWRGKLSHTFIVGLNKGTTDHHRSEECESAWPSCRRVVHKAQRTALKNLQSEGQDPPDPGEHDSYQVLLTGRQGPQVERASAKLTRTENGFSSVRSMSSHQQIARLKEGKWKQLGCSSSS